MSEPSQPRPPSRGRGRSRQTRKPTRKSTKDASPPPDPPTNSPEHPAEKEDPFPNYAYRPENTFVGFILLVSNLIVFCCLVVLVFASPNLMSGGPAILRKSGEFIGVLRKCTATACDPFMAGTSSASSPATASPATASPPPVARADTTEASSSGTVPPSGSPFDLVGMFLTTGLAALSALWFSIYILLSTTFRLWANTPPLGETWMDGIKRFVYRLSRALLVVNTVLVPSLILDVVVKANEFRGAEGLISVIGGGLALIVLAFLFTLLSTLIELGTPNGRIHTFVRWFNCMGERRRPVDREDKAEKGQQ